MVPKRLAAQETRQSKGLVSTLAYAELVNFSTCANHVAFAFQAINRSVDVFRTTEVEKLPHACQCCDVRYHHMRADGTAACEEGVVWFRMATDVATSCTTCCRERASICASSAPTQLRSRCFTPM